MQGLLTPARKSLLNEHAGIFASASLVIICAVRILAFTNGDVQLALAVLSVGQQFTILMGTLFIVVVGCAAYALFTMESTIWPNPNRAESTASTAWRAVAYSTCFLLVMSSMPVLPILALLVFAVVMNVWAALRKRRGKSAQPTGLQTFLRFLLQTLVLVLIFFLLSTPWTPTENISFKEDGKTRMISGHAIGEQAGMLMVVNTARRSIQWVDIDALSARELCSKTGEPKWVLLRTALELNSTRNRPQVVKCQGEPG